MRKTFEEWKKEVEQHLLKKVGITSEFLPDVPYTEWYRNKMSSETAANKVIRLA